MDPHTTADPGAHKETIIADDWRKQPPYAPSEGQKIAFYTATCHCSRVEYAIYSERPLDSKFCHCTECQRLHGAPVQWAAIFHKTSIRFTPSSLEHLAFYHAPTDTQAHTLPCKVACAHCRAPLLDEGRNMLMVFPSLIRFTDPPRAGSTDSLAKTAKEKRRLFLPRCHIFYGSRVVDHLDGKPKYRGHQGGETMPEDE
ncbi:Mss4-like protein [Schizophyllum fasciatum]